MGDKLLIIFVSVLVVWLSKGWPVEFPPGAPVPLGEHPRLMVTGAEIAQVKQKAEKLPWLKEALAAIVQQADQALYTEVTQLPEKHSTDHFTLADRATSLGYAALITSDKKYALKAKEIILHYAEEYKRYPLEPEAYVFNYSLPEAMWLSKIADACDLLFASGVLKETERKKIEDDLLRPAADCVMRDFRSAPDRKDGHHQCYNFQAVHCAAVGEVGFLLGEKRYIEWAISDIPRVELPKEGKGIFDFGYGFRHLVKHDIRDDGFFWERSIGYHFMVAHYAAQLCEAALRNGIDLWGLQVPDDSTENENGSGNYTCDANNGKKCVKFLLDAPLYYAFGNLLMAGVADANPTHLSQFASLYELAYKRYKDPHYAWLLNCLYPPVRDTPIGWKTWSPSGKPSYGISDKRPFSGKFCAFIECSDEKSRGCLVSSLVSVKPGENLNFSVAYRTEEVEAGKCAAVVRLEFYSPTGRARQDLETYLEGGEASEKWKILSINFAIPEGVVQVGVEMFCWLTRGRVYYDKAFLKREGDEENLLINGDFEFASSRRVPESGVLPWNIAEKLPAGKPLLKEGKFALTGTVRSGSTLFPASGYAILRHKPNDPNSLSVLMTYGPYGGGHGHKDKLSISVYYKGRQIIPDLPTASYESPIHSSWTMQTISHNTISVDSKTQYPVGRWAHDTSEKPSMGLLKLFHADEFSQIVRATCDNVYEGVLLDRTLCLVDDVLLDIFSASSRQEHIYDWAIRSPGEPKTDLELWPMQTPMGTEHGYQHLSNLRGAKTNASLNCTFALNGDGLRLTISAFPDTQFILCDGLIASEDSKMPMLIARRKSPNTTFAAVLMPEDDKRKAEVTLEDAEGNRIIQLHIGDKKYLIALRDGNKPIKINGAIIQSEAIVAQVDDRSIVRASLIGLRNFVVKGQSIRLVSEKDCLLQRQPEGKYRLIHSWNPVTTGGVFIP